MNASTDKFGVEIGRDIGVVRLDYEISHRLTYLGRLRGASLHAAHAGLAMGCSNSHSLIS